MEITINVPELKELSEAIKTLSSTLGYNKSELTEQAVQNAQIEPQTMTTSLRFSMICSTAGKTHGASASIRHGWIWTRY